VISRIVTVLVAIGCLVLAFLPARDAAVGLTMPYDMDQFREIASAQAIADGHPLRDPFYRDEWVWYNPLLGATVAGISRVTALPVHEAFVQAGPWLSVAAQALFFAMALVLVGPWPAAIALALLLFAPPHGISGWMSPAVTPFIFSNNYATTFFYAGLIACASAAGRREAWRWALLGALLGLTFLAHTAPALVLGCCGVAAALYAAGGSAGSKDPAPRPSDPALRLDHPVWRGRVRTVVVMLAVAIVVSSPFLYSIAGRYHLHVRNLDPVLWLWEQVDLAHLSGLARALLSPAGLLAIVGAVVLARRARVDRGAFVAVSWGATALVLFAYGYLQQLTDNRYLPPLVPQHHFYFHVVAAGRLLAGVGAWTIVSALCAALARTSGWKPALRLSDVAAPAIVLAGIYLVVTVNDAKYRDRPDFQEYRREAIARSDDFARTRVIERLRAQTPADAVILASDEDSYYRVAPAGRATVAVPSIQSNPYVTQGGRDADQQQMLDALQARDPLNFGALARKYGVGFVLLGPDAVAGLEASGPAPSLVRELSRQGGYVLYEWTGKSQPGR
jgi:hypothetical protein